MSAKRGVGSFVLGVFKEGIAHAVLAVGMWFLFDWIFNAGIASVAVATFWIGREARDTEIEFGPSLWKAIGFKTPFPLAPAKRWSVEQLRHSISGWLPVCILMAILYGIHALR